MLVTYSINIPNSLSFSLAFLNMESIAAMIVARLFGVAALQLMFVVEWRLPELRPDLNVRRWGI